MRCPTSTRSAAGRPAGLAGLVAALVCLLSGPLTLAQAASSRGGEVDQGAAREPGLSGYREAGPIHYALSLRLRQAGYDANVFLDRRDEKDDFSIKAGPELRSVLRLGGSAWLSAYGSVEYAAHARHSSLNHKDSRAGAELTGWLGDLRMIGGIDASRLVLRPSTEVDERVPRHESALRSSLLYELTADSALEAGVSRLDESYGEAAGLDYDRLLGHDERLVSVSARHRVGGFTWAGLELARATRDGRDEGQVKDLSRDQALVGLEFRPGGWIEGEARVGVADVQAGRTAGIADQRFRGGTSRGDVTMRAGSRSRLRLLWQRSFTPSTYLDNAYFRHDRAEAGLTRELTSRVAVEAGLARGFVSYPIRRPEPRRDRIEESFAGVRVRLGPVALLHLRAAVWSRDSSVEGEDRRRFTVEQSLTVPL